MRSRPPEPISVRISAVVRTLAACIVFLVVASTLLQLDKYSSAWVPRSIVRLFYLDEESNFPTYFSAVQLLCAAVLLGYIACHEYHRTGRHFRAWVVLAVGFLGMSLDEFCRLHEMMMKPMQTLLGGTNLGLFQNAWVVPALIGVFALGLYFARFLWSLPQALRNQFLLAAVLFVGGSVGVEMPEGRYAAQHGVNNMGFVAFVTVEETLEMVGILIFVRALLGHVAANYSPVNLAFLAPSGSEAQKPI